MHETIIEDYRQLPLPGLDTIDALREYLLPERDNQAVGESSTYALMPENFLDTIENRLGTIDFRYSNLFLGHVDLGTRIYDAFGRSKADLTLATNGTTHERQAETLAHEMTHVDRMRSEPVEDPLVEEYGHMTVKEFNTLFPHYFPAVLRSKEREEEVVLRAGREFYKSHTSLAKLALCLVWRRYKTEFEEKSV